MNGTWVDVGGRVGGREGSEETEVRRERGTEESFLKEGGNQEVDMGAGPSRGEVEGERYGKKSYVYFKKTET